MRKLLLTKNELIVILQQSGYIWVVPFVGVDDHGIGNEGL